MRTLELPTLLVAGPGEGLAMSQRMGPDAFFLLRHLKGWWSWGLDDSADPLHSRVLLERQFNKSFINDSSRSARTVHAVSY